jgi:ATP-dependent Lon protease
VETGPTLKILGRRPVDLPLLVEPLLAEVPDLTLMRLHVPDQVRDWRDFPKLFEKKLEIALATLVKDLPFLPLRNLIAFPRMVCPVFVGRPESIKAIRSAANRQLPIVMAAQKDPAVESPGDADIYRIGVVGNLLR